MREGRAKQANVEAIPAAKSSVVGNASKENDHGDADRRARAAEAPDPPQDQRDAEQPRLTVFRSAKHIYAQVVDDTAGSTIAHASTLSRDVRAAVSAPAGGDAADVTKIDAAKKVGRPSPRSCSRRRSTSVVFDRNGYLYHGRVRALADAAREAGLKF